MRLRLLALLTIALILTGVLPVYAEPATAAALTVSVTGTAGAPLGGARVELIAPGMGTVAEGLTDSTGRASLSAPTGAAIFWVRAWGAGYKTVDRPWVPAADGKSLELQLPALLGTLSGLVTDHLGQPVPGASVSAWRRDVGLVAEVRTGANGAYSLRALTAPGPYQIQVSAPGFQAYASRPMSVSGGEEKQLDITLPPATATVTGEVAEARTGAPISGARVELVRKGWGILASATTGAGGSFSLAVPAAENPDYTVRVLAKDHSLLASPPFALAPGARREFTGADRLMVQPTGGSVWGVVTDDFGIPVTGVAVDLQLQGVGTAASVTTDTDGFYTFDRVEGGTYRVRVHPSGLTSHMVTDSPWITLAPGAARYVEVVALDEVTRQFYGFGVVAGQVTGPAGQAVAGAEVSLLWGDEGVVFSATTDDQGRYRITDVDANRSADSRPPGSGYVVRVVKEGFWTSDQPTQPGTLVDVTQSRVTQTDFVLRPASGALSGVVTDDQGKPVAGAKVNIYRDSSGTAYSATTGADGSYRFSSLPVPLQGGYVVEAEQAGFVTAASDSPADVAGAPGAAAREVLRIRPAVARLQGRAVGALGAPLAGATVTVLGPGDGSTRETRADENGWYAMDDLPAGPGDLLLVRGSAGERNTATASDGALALAGVRARTVNLQLSAAGAVAGTVYDSHGVPVSAVVVELWREGQADYMTRTSSGADGRYRFDNLAPGDRYAVVARKEGYTPSGLTPDEPAVTPLFQAVTGAAIQVDLAVSGQ